MKLSTLALGIAALALPASAIAQERSCIPQAESRAVVATLLPDMIDSAAGKCAPTLGRNGYLSSNAAELGDRLSPLAEESWPQARGTFETILGTQLPDSPELMAFGRMAVAEAIVQDLKPEQCTQIDRLVEQIAPLPVENFANVFALFLEFGLNEAEDAPFSVCPARR